MRRNWILKLPLLAFISLFFFHFYMVVKHSVNVPFWDEWDLLHADGLPAGLHPRWLFSFHNEHRIVLTRLVHWLSFQLLGLNLRIQIIFNFAIFGLVLLLIVRFARRTGAPAPMWVLFSFLIFLLSANNHENHLWAFQSSYHFFVLFFLMAAYFLFREEQRRTSLLAGTVSAILSAYSLGGGEASALVLLALFCIFKLERLFSSAEPRRRELVQLLLVAVPLTLALAFWFTGFQKAPQIPPLTWPHTILFWRFLATLVSLAFGFDYVKGDRDALCLLFVLAPVAGEIWKRRGRLPASSWAVFAVMLGTLGSLGSISVGRAGFGLVEGRFARYFEAGMLLVPFSVLAWSIFLREWPRLKIAALISLWLLCMVGFRDNWRQFRAYELIAGHRRAGLECTRQYYEQGGEPFCPQLYPGPIKEQLDLARQFNLSFYRKQKGKDERGMLKGERGIKELE
ncbi:MAG TPA: hypothetical protein VGB17_01525 [Pyrinomonadaceae bacterium]|jgi:hypothetical protein